MSAYALLARAWGAEVRGWDRTHTPYLEQLAGIDIEISDEPPQPPAGGQPAPDAQSGQQDQNGDNKAGGMGASSSDQAIASPSKSMACAA